MSCNTFKGRDHSLQGAFNLGGVYNTVPTGRAVRLKFSTLTLDRGDIVTTDNTIIPDQVLLDKPDIIDQAPTGSLTSIACLNEARYWMQALFGVPTTTGTAPNLVHTFTLGSACRPDQLLDLGALNPGQASLRINRYTGGMATSFSWDVLSEEQNWEYGLLMGREVTPAPTTRFDATPILLPKARAVARRNSVRDAATEALSTLGAITGCTLNIALNLSPQRLADGLAGYGDVLSGQIEISGTITALYRTGGLADYARDDTPRPLIITGAAIGNQQIVFNLPNVMFRNPANEISTAESITRTYNWVAYTPAGGTAPTCVLTNSIASLTA